MHVIAGRSNREYAKEILNSIGATQGCYPKAWIRKDNTFFLMKDGGSEPVENELLASKIARCFHAGFRIILCEP